MPDFIPRSDRAAAVWAAAFAQQIGLAAGRLGISQDDVDLLAAQQRDFGDAVQAALDPRSRTPVAVVRKNGARAAFAETARRLAGTVRAMVGSDRAELSSLGLATGPGRRGPRRRVGRPTGAPRVTVRRVDATRVSVRLWNPDAPSRRGKAPGIAGATLFSFVGDVPPASAVGWRMHGTTSTVDVTLKFSAALPPGTKVWIVAQWMNGRCEAGPVSSATYAHLTYGGPVGAAA